MYEGCALALIYTTVQQIGPGLTSGSAPFFADAQPKQLGEH